jgi:hypothetical protein
MRNYRAPHGTGKEGFSTVEMLLLLISVAVFLLGVVALVSRGVSSVQPSKGEAEMNREATRLLDRIQALVEGARAISTLPGANPGLENTRLLFLADLDGSGGQVRLKEGGTGIESTGLETVAMMRSNAGSMIQEIPTGRNLYVTVWGDSPKASQILLTSMLDPSDGRAFIVGFTQGEAKQTDVGEAAAGAQRVTAVRVSVRLRLRGELRQYARPIHLRDPALVTPLDALR